jgi:sugar phosphate isomerase/epimerase
MAKKVQLPWPVSVGIWFVEGKGGDRFTSSYKPGMPIMDRIDLVGKMRGVRGIEIHVPYEVTEDTFESVRKRARDNGLKIVTVVPGLFNEQRFKDGALISYRKEIRKEAIERIKTAMKMNEELRKNNEGGHFAIYWPAADGCTYSFSNYHPERRKMMLDGLVECLQSAPGNIAIEHKPSDPAAKTYNGTTVEAILLCRDIIKAIGEKNKERIGINPEMAHLLMADALLGEEVSRILEEGLLRHTHWNTIRRKGADTDMMVGTDNWQDSMEVFFWLEEYKYKGWLGLDLLPKSEDTTRAVEVSVQAMERMYAEVMSVKDKLKENMKNPDVDATANQLLILGARGTEYEPVK